MRAAICGALILPLAACVVGGEGAMGLLPKGGKAAEAPRGVAFFGGDVVVTGPSGYCVDPGSVQQRRDAAFALLASCSHLGRTAGDTVPPAVITVSVLARDAAATAPTASRLAAPWANAGVVQKIDAEGISLIQLKRGGDTLLPGGDPRHWRGAMVTNGHMIGLAAYGNAGSRAQTGRDLLITTSRAMRDASPRRPVIQTAAPSSIDANAAAKPGPARRTRD